MDVEMSHEERAFNEANLRAAMNASLLNDEDNLDDYLQEFSDEDTEREGLPNPFVDQDPHATPAQVQTTPVHGPPRPIPVYALGSKLRTAYDMITSEMKFSGELPSGTTTDLTSLVSVFRYNLGFVVSACELPHDKSNLIAMRLLSGRAMNEVIAASQRKSESVPSMETINAVLDSLSRGTAIGPITLTERIWATDLKQIALKLSQELKGELPDLNRCISAAQALLAQRPEKMTDPDLVHFWLRALRGFPAIAKEIRLTSVNGALVEQTDPTALVTTLMSYNPQFKEAMLQEIKGKRPTEVSYSRPSGPGAPAASKSGWQPARSSGMRSPRSSRATSPGQRPSKRAGSQVKNSRDDPTFDPFKKLSASRLSATSQPGWLLWIKGQTRAQRDELAKEGRCFVCKSTDHRVDTCSLKGKAFNEKRFCFFSK